MAGGGGEGRGYPSPAAAGAKAKAHESLREGSLWLVAAQVDVGCAGGASSWVGSGERRSHCRGLREGRASITVGVPLDRQRWAGEPCGLKGEGARTWTWGIGWRLQTIHSAFTEYPCALGVREESDLSAREGLWPAGEEQLGPLLAAILILVSRGCALPPAGISSPVPQAWDAPAGPALSRACLR